MPEKVNPIQSGTDKMKFWISLFYFGALFHGSAFTRYNWFDGMRMVMHVLTQETRLTPAVLVLPNITMRATESTWVACPLYGHITTLWALKDQGALNHQTK